MMTLNETEATEIGSMAEAMFIASKTRSRLIPIARTYLTLIYPVLLILLGARLVMSESFLRFEYNRPDFPADFYGLSTEDRLTFAPYAVNYLLNGEDIDYLADLTFPDGTAFNARELRHMRDVKELTTAAFAFAVGAGGLAIAAVAYLWRRAPNNLALALRNGSLLTIGLILLIALLTLAAWDFFFTAFHEIFFADDTWYFLYSDNLIRLFPEQFWFDAAILIGVIAVLAALVTLTIVRVTAGRKELPASTPHPPTPSPTQAGRGGEG
jgi:integral membrane protein (TIGR01906 family)